MGVKGQKTTSDYIEFDRCMYIGNKLLKENKKEVMGLYIIIAVNTGLRVSDLLDLKWKNFESNTIELYEKKTNKYRKIRINDSIKSAIVKVERKNDFVFISQKKGVFSIQRINILLKQIFKKENKKLSISTHSLRKSFGRRVYQNNNESEKSLLYLSELFNHSSIAVTRKYLGIRQEELDDIYMNL